MDSVLPHVALLVLLVGTQAFFSGLAWLNLRYSDRMLERERAWLAEQLEVADPDEIGSYHRLTTGLGQLRGWIALGALLIALYAGIFTAGVEAVASLEFGLVGEGVVFFLATALLVYAFGIPFDIVDTFVVDEVFEFNQQSLTLWGRDQLLSVLITAVFVAILAGAVLAFIVVLEQWWWLAAWGFVMAFSLAMNVIYPRVIAPLFNEFEPIESGELREAIEDVFDKAGFECSQIYTMDASRRSSKLNAYFVGFGRTKRVVLFDTLVERLHTKAIQATLVHELAHWKRAHIWKGLAAEAVRLFVVFAVLGYLVSADWMYAMFDIPTEARYAGLVLGLVWIGPVMRWSSPLSNRLWLRFEREADRFAVEVMGGGDGMSDALTELAQENLANPFPHPYYAAFHYQHPPIPERLRAIREHDEG